MSDLTILAVIVLSVGALVVPRRYLPAIPIIAACFIPVDQRVIVSGLDLTALRILLCVAVLRLVVGGECVRVRWSNFDWLVLAWALCGAAVYSLQWMTTKAVINRCGVFVDIMGMYWLFRQTIRSWADIRQAAVVYAFCAVALVPLVAMEWLTGRNPFSVMGHVVTLVRSNHYRCAAAFPHSIMLGVFWAAIIPLFIAFIRAGRDKGLFWMAMASAVFIVTATASSTPVVTLAIAIGAMAMWKWRRYIPMLAIVCIVVLVGLHLAMRAPVWHLLARINVVPGSTGWYRFYLLDQAISHFQEWAPLGCRNTEAWGMGLGDITNQYVLEGVRGGLITLLLFVAVLLVGASRLLKISLCEVHPQKRMMVCAVLAMLATHCAAFGGVSYFGQMTMEWYMVLAVTGLLIEWQKDARSVLVRDESFRPEGQLAGT